MHQRMRLRFLLSLLAIAVAVSSYSLWRTARIRATWQREEEERERIKQMVGSRFEHAVAEINAAMQHGGVYPDWRTNAVHANRQVRPGGTGP